MADFLDSEAEESEDEEEYEQSDKRKPKRHKKMESDDEEDEDDEANMQEELKDLIDDNPIDDDESDGGDSDGSGGSRKRKNSDDDELDDRLEDDDYDLIEENLGVKVERRKRFKRLRIGRIGDDESDNEDAEQDEGEERDAIANELFEHEDNETDERDEETSERGRVEPETYGEEDEEGDSDDYDDFIVDDENRPVRVKKKKKPTFSDAALQEAQDIFGVDFDYDEFGKYEEDEYDEEEEDEYIEEEDEDGERRQRPKKAVKKKPTRKSIFEIYEPSELKRGHFTDLDNKIRIEDIPERMQLRDVPMTAVPDGSDELDEEAKWIYKHAFLKPSISQQDIVDRQQRKNGALITQKIKKALDFIRNQQYEVPFIAFYRKEYVQPELSINDLWRVYKYDAKWCQLRSRKMTLISLFEKMRDYQAEQLMKDVDTPIPDSVRLIKDEDIERLKGVQTTEELKDVHSHFLLYYAHDVSPMQESVRAKEREEARAARKAAKLKKAANPDGEDEDGEGAQQDENDDEDEEPPPPPDTVKQAVRSGPYYMCRKAGIDGFAKRFGLTPDQFAENLRDNYQRHEVDQESASPVEVAKEYCSSKFVSAEEVMQAAKYMVSTQIAREPLIRRCVRETFFERAKIDVRPTKKGLKEIDENHPCYGLKYLKNKPVCDLVNDQYLKLHMAEEDKLLTIKFNEHIDGITSASYLEEMKQLYYRDEFAGHVQDWNALRTDCVDTAIRKMLLPDLVKEIRSHLVTEAKEFVLRACCRKLYSWIKVAPIAVEFGDDDDDDWDTSKGLRVMALAYVPDYSQASFACLMDAEGECAEFVRLPHVLKRKNSFRDEEKAQKEADIQALKNFILTKKPHVIVVGAESREALMISADLKEIVTNLMEDEQFPQIPVEIIDNELSKVYANSIKGESDYRDYPMLLRQAISLARRIKDPLVEFSQLCTSDDEILCLRYHPLQDQLTREELLEGLNLEFVNRTNEVGVDVNAVVATNHSGNLIQFVCGLGPRKGAALIKLLKQTNQRLENRTQLVTACHMGPKVFINCAGFIKIDTYSLGDSTDAYVEVLDGSRVHPETYEWARKMAVDALEYEDEETNNPASALEEILEAPERLKDLDLDAFAEELERQGFGNKSITLYDIRAELNHRYKDMREAFVTANPEELFDMLTKECPDTFYIGKMVTATVTGISHKKPEGDQLDAANPVRNDETGLWQCPFCLKNDFPELSEVWNHFDAGGCPGQAVGVRIRLDNGVSGYIHIKNLSDDHVTDPKERVNRGQLIYCRITKIDVEKFAVDATSKSSDLADKNHEWRPTKDPFYDVEAESKDKKQEEDAKKGKTRQTYMKRVIVHPAFHNISFAEAEKILINMEQGDVIVRPSSKGSDHLTVTWKVGDGIYQHIDVREEGKENAFSLGQSLWIGTEEFEDLDEIIARHVSPMAAYARDLLQFRYYKDTEGGIRDKAEEFLKEEKKKNASKIHYIIAASKNYPGKFMLSYLPRLRCKHEFVTVTPEGFRFRGQMFDSVAVMFRWFKEHFRDPLPGTPSTPRTGMMMTNRTTPFMPHTPAHLAMAITPGMNPDAMRRVAPNVGSHVLHNIPQVAAHTPHYAHTPAGFAMPAYQNTPYTPSGQTPFMTPYHTPHHAPMTQTPRYGQQTPSQSHAQPMFLHPGSMTPTPSHTPSTPTQRQQATPSHSPMASHSRNAVSTDPNHWRMRAEEWARQKQRETVGTPRSEGHTTPRGAGNPYDSRSKTTPRYEGDVRGTPRHSTNHRSPRTPSYKSPHAGANNYDVNSPRVAVHSSRGQPYNAFGFTGKSPHYSPSPSTPRTINSPRSMIESSLGDATPLYDEN